jgi:hypothetical protein
MCFKTAEGAENAQRKKTPCSLRKTPRPLRVIKKYFYKPKSTRRIYTKYTKKLETFVFFVEHFVPFVVKKKIKNDNSTLN